MPTATKKLDWTEKFDPGFGIIRWEDWATQVIAAIKNGDAEAEAGLMELSQYLDSEYDGLAVEPLTNLRMGWDH